MDLLKIKLELYFINFFQKPSCYHFTLYNRNNFREIEHSDIKYTNHQIVPSQWNIIKIKSYDYAKEKVCVSLHLHYGPQFNRDNKKKENPPFYSK